MSGSIAETPLEHIHRRLEAETLTRYVRQLLGRKQLDIMSWGCEVVHGGASRYVGALGVFRVYGVARDGTEHLPWSLILKVISGPTGGGGRSLSGYWKREALAYQSGLLRNLPGNLSAPICYGVTEVAARDDGVEEAWIWLEEIAQVDKLPWTFDRLQQVACALGRFNGAYLGQDLRSAYPWLGQGRTESWMVLSEPVLQDLEHYRKHPFVATWIPDESMRRLLKLWQAREVLLRHLQPLPHTLCHHDAFVRNLLIQSTPPGERVAVVDWDYIGLGALGEEIALLVGASYNFLELDVANIRQVEEHVWAGYLMGLREAGWLGDIRSVRFAYAATSALVGAIGWVGVWMPYVVGQMEAIEELLGHSAAEIAAAWPHHLRHQLDLGEEALRQVGSAQPRHD